jgi:hypothetical protein
VSRPIRRTIPHDYGSPVSVMKACSVAHVDESSERIREETMINPDRSPEPDEDNDVMIDLEA